MDWFKEGKIKPIHPVTVFDSSQVIEAFRYMQKGTHMGKILIRMPEDASNMTVSPPKPKIRLSPEASYLLVGGLGGIGQAISNFLVEKGARHLTFLSRSAGQSEEHTRFSKELQAQGCQSILVQGSVTDIKDVQKAVQSCGKPIAGVIQLSMVLKVRVTSTSQFVREKLTLKKDQSFSKMSLEEWNTAVGPKVAGTWNLHTVLEHSSLDFFVVFGSVSGTCGNPGQANYAAANSFLDAFVQYRRNKGLPASVLSLGFVGDVGIVSQDQKLLNRADATAVQFVREKDIMDALELVISDSSVATRKITKTDEKYLSQSNSLVIGLALTKPVSGLTTVPFWGNDRRFLSYENYELPSSETKIESDETDLREFMGQISKDPDLLKQDATETKILQELGKVIVPHTASGQQGQMSDEEISGVAIDSLMSIEIKNWARRKLTIDIALTEISKAATIGGLAKLTLEKLRLKYAPQQEGGEKPSGGSL
jgi:NAD(P)-dependent dehydrogenase (short-subunit alcohol dehydrogenase family)